MQEPSCTVLPPSLPLEGLPRGVVCALSGQRMGCARRGTLQQRTHVLRQGARSNALALVWRPSDGNPAPTPRGVMPQMPAPLTTWWPVHRSSLQPPQRRR